MMSAMMELKTGGNMTADTSSGFCIELLDWLIVQLRHGIDISS